MTNFLSVIQVIIGFCLSQLQSISSAHSVKALSTLFLLGFDSYGIYGILTVVRLV